MRPMGRLSMGRAAWGRMVPFPMCGAAAACLWCHILRFGPIFEPDRSCPLFSAVLRSVTVAHAASYVRVSARVSGQYATCPLTRAVPLRTTGHTAQCVPTCTTRPPPTVHHPPVHHPSTVHNPSTVHHPPPLPCTTRPARQILGNAARSVAMMPARQVPGQAALLSLVRDLFHRFHLVKVQ
jgi:hypothetical protein